MSNETPVREHSAAPWGSPHIVPPWCELPVPSRTYRYVMFALIVILIMVQLRYRVAFPQPGIVITGGAGYAITLRVPRVRFAHARLA